MSGYSSTALPGPSRSAAADLDSPATSSPPSGSVPAQHARRRLARWSARSFGKLRARDTTLEDVLNGHGARGLAAFEDFLAHTEHSSENLLFIVAFRAYQRRFLELPEHVRAATPRPQTLRGDRWAEADGGRRRAWEVSRGLLSARDAERERVAAAAAAGYSAWRSWWPFFRDRSSSSDPLTAPSDQQAAHAASLLRQLQMDAARLSATFLVPGARKELNLDDRIRARVLRDVRASAHPDAFLPAVEHVHAMLESHSLGHFLRVTPEASLWTSERRQLIAGGLALSTSLASYILLVLLLPSRPVGWRALRLVSAPFAWLGIKNLYGAVRRMPSARPHKLQPWVLDEPEGAPDRAQASLTIDPAEPSPTATLFDADVQSAVINSCKPKDIDAPPRGFVSPSQQASVAAIPDWDDVLPDAPSPPSPTLSAVSTRCSSPLAAAAGRAAVSGPDVFVVHPRVLRRRRWVAREVHAAAAAWTALWVVVCLAAGR